MKKCFVGYIFCFVCVGVLLVFFRYTLNYKIECQKNILFCLSSVKQNELDPVYLKQSVPIEVLKKRLIEVNAVKRDECAKKFNDLTFAIKNVSVDVSKPQMASFAIDDIVKMAKESGRYMRLAEEYNDSERCIKVWKPGMSTVDAVTEANRIDKRNDKIIF